MEMAVERVSRLKYFQKSRFATIFERYEKLSGDDQKEMLILLEAVEHEIERRQMRRELEQRYPIESLVA
jgi:hypothetical protein